MDSHRQPIPLEQAQQPLFLGVDVGGNSIKFGVVDNLGRTLAYKCLPTLEERGPDDAVQRTATATRELLAESKIPFDRIVACGLGCPGTMDIPRGLLLEPPNLPHWRDYPIRDRLAKAISRPVAFANDANAAAFGECWVGCGRDYHSIVMLTLGTGVGGGIIVGDVSIDGEHSHGSECGHILVDTSPEARRCSCGMLGHLEAYASATAVVQRAEEALASGRATSLRAALDRGEVLNGLLVAHQAEAGDPFANELILSTAEYLATGIVSLVHAIDPGAVILGGAMNFGAEANPVGKRFIEQVRSSVRARVFPVLAKNTKIVYASLGGDAGFIGAAGIARTVHARTCVPKNN